jgi:3-oxoadipate enol-lactonase
MEEVVKSLSVGGARLSCLDRGRGLPLLFVHGFPFDHTMWAGQSEVLSSQYRVIAPDLRGFGRSLPERPFGCCAQIGGRKGDRSNLPERPFGCCAQIGPVPFSASTAVTMGQFADDLAAMLDVLGVNEPIVYCGLSMGGYIALQFWRKYADRLRGLVLCDTRAAADAPEVAAARQAAADRVLAEGVAPLVETMLPRLFSEATQRQRPELVEALRRVMLASPPEGVAAASRGMAVRPDMTAALGDIRCPTLVVVGQEDGISTAAEMRGIAEAIPAATFVEIPAAGHVSPLENPAAVNAAILDFLATL